MARLYNRKALEETRRDLRRRQTPAEAKLWAMLRNRRLRERKFRRQHSVGSYVVDFYCPKEQLAIELDGSTHDDPMRREYDQQRTAFLEAEGIRVLRFENREVMKTPDLVLEAIAMYFGEEEDE